ncbi:MAG: CotH kinase family protein [Bacteroidales bacterium]|nr:CotH kinase family protein [Bacteroidales bacterium]MCF8390965.1 CotH kinase family protein [Bacteroidales bacterium]
MKKILSILAATVLFSAFSFSQDFLNWESLVNAEFTWRYSLGNDTVPENWKALNYEDSNWASGSGGIGYEDGDDATIITQTSCLYIRHNFNIINLSEIQSLQLYLDYDDGFIAYLNGIEIARENMTNAGVNPSFDQFTDHCDHEAKMPVGGLPDKFSIDQTLISSVLIEGENCLAVEIHNCSATSSDLSSSTWLIASTNNTSDKYYETPGWFVAPTDGSSKLPLIVIETNHVEIPNEPKIEAFMKVIDNGLGMTNYISDAGTDYSGKIGIEVRGQSSQYFFPKDSYSVETRDEFGEDLKANLLGMPEESDWILHAPYSDKTLMRNALTYHLGIKMGDWAPRFKYCELYLNGDYQGIYLLMEKIKRDGDRVDVEKTNSTHNSGDSLTGGYIVRVDKVDGLTQNLDYFFGSAGYAFPGSRDYAFSYYYPEAEKITSEQKIYIRDFLYDLETALNAPYFKDPETGFRKFMDGNSFADFQIMQELGNNVDGYRYSTYFNKNADSKDGRLHAGPLWDFNLCYGNVNYADRNFSTTEWLYPNYGPYEYQTMHWWSRLMQDPDYQQNLMKRYSIFRNTFFSNDSIMGYIDETIDYLGEAIDRNFIRWPILGIEIWPNKFIGNSYVEEINFFKTWLADRLTFLDNNWYYDVGIGSRSLSNVFDVIVYPNPVSAYLNIEIRDKDLYNYRLQLYDLTGKLILENSMSKGESINLSFIEKGIYILKLSSEEELFYNQKLIKQ